MKIDELMAAVANSKIDSRLAYLYGEENVKAQRGRYISLLEKAKENFGDREASIFSAPGRTEIGGNHTDHQLGKVVTASIDLDVAAVVVPTDDNIVTYKSDNFNVKPVNVSDVEIKPLEKNTTEALIRGTAAGLLKKGYNIGGFMCYAQSNVLPGSGMSSSAAFEVLIGSIFSGLFNEGKVSPEEIAKNGQFAENTYFMKNSGLQDQMACAVGSIAAIDFNNKDNPFIEKIDFNPADYGYDLILTDCKESHADLSDEYGLIPAEMRHVAECFSRKVMSEVSMEELISHTAMIRANCGDRAWLRAYHFLRETKRADEESDALKKRDFPRFLKLVRESGRSSWMYLQNVSVSGSASSQPLAVALALSEKILGESGAWRVHGGGFAGTIQAFVKREKSNEYIRQMEKIFGNGCSYKLRIRNVGGVKII